MLPRSVLKTAAQSPDVPADTCVCLDSREFNSVKWHGEERSPALKNLPGSSKKHSMVNDPIADFITRLKNAAMVRHTEVTLPYSNMKKAIARALQQASFVGTIEETEVGKRKMLSIELLYERDGTPKIQGVQRISKPGRRLYAGVKQIHPVKYGRGVMVLSTPRGILVDADARKMRVGGETLFTMW